MFNSHSVFNVTSLLVILIASNSNLNWYMDQENVRTTITFDHTKYIKYVSTLVLKFGWLF